MSHLERLRRRVSASNPLELESWVRALCIHYYFHVSDKQAVEIDTSAHPDAPRVLQLLTPTLFKGQGRIRLAPGVVFGVVRSPGSHACSYVEARTPGSLITIGVGTVINNRASLVSEGAGIHIGARCLIGTDVEIVDTNFHQLEIGRRHLPDAAPRPVVIEDDVFIGSRVTVLKGARIGRGSIVSAGCVVPPSFEAPPMSVVAGNPARIVGQVAEPAPA